MADKTFHLEVITPDRSAVSGEMISLQVNATDGMMGVLCNHAPLIATLSTGLLNCKDSTGNEKVLAVGDGFIEIYDNKVKALCDFADFPEELDAERAKKAKDRAMERMQARKEEIDFLRAEAALKRAMVRLKLLGSR